jgi:mannonate dehydratase
MMKLGLGLNPHMLNAENFRFARQAGATHIVMHPNIYHQVERAPGSKFAGGGMLPDPRPPWTYEELSDLKAAMNAEGLVFEAIENFNPCHWHDILLDGPKKREQMEDVKQMIRAMGKAGVPIMGYNFSIGGVWGHVAVNEARGGAQTVRFGLDQETPIPQGMVWNMVYDPSAPNEPMKPVSHEELWGRLEYFLKEIMPVAEENNVMMALHPDDPPMPTIRGSARLVNVPGKYQRVLDIYPSPKNGMEFCIGTLAEMDDPADNDIYDVIDRYSATGRIGYIHFRNVRGKVPNYVEVFVDEGDVDMVKALRILHKNGYAGVLIPDHTPAMSCAAPWHAGMAFALGYMKAAIRLVEEAG